MNREKEIEEWGKEIAAWEMDEEGKTFVAKHFSRYTLKKRFSFVP